MRAHPRRGVGSSASTMAGTMRARPRSGARAAGLPRTDGLAIERAVGIRELHGFPQRDDVA